MATIREMMGHRRVKLGTFLVELSRWMLAVPDREVELRDGAGAVGVDLREVLELDLGHGHPNFTKAGPKE